MFAFSRLQARQFRALLRQSVLPGSGRAAAPAVLLEGTPDGLRLSSQQAGLALSLLIPGPCPAERWALPLAALEACAGSADTPVQAEPQADATILLHWQHGPVPCVQRFDPATGDVRPPPALPTHWQDGPPGLLDALAQATQSASAEALRYALNHLLLDGDHGTISATDGRHLLVQHGLAFPWTGPVLVPRLSAFGSRDLAAAGTVRLGRTDTHVVVAVGPWTLHLPVLKDGRFPPVAEVVPRPDRLRTVLRLDAADAVFLARSLPALPGARDEHVPVTLDLGESVAVRARAAGQPQATEVTLTGSRCEGAAVRLVLDRTLLARALRLGLTELHVEAANKPVLAQDATRQCVIMPLDPDSAVLPGPDTLRLSSVASARPAMSAPPAPPSAAVPIPLPMTRSPAMSARPHTVVATNGHVPPAVPAPAKAGGYAALQAEAQALQSLVRDALGRVNALVAALKQHRRQARAVQASLVALRDLQTVEA